MFEVILVILIILFSVIIHEVAHGYAAYMLGDPTAHLEGRLTLNPIPHIDFFGTILIPAFLVLTNAGILFGWAKPVPYNPYNLKGRFSEAFVAAAGALTNILLAVIFAGIGNAIFLLDLQFTALLSICQLVVYVNLFLAILNLIPIPPLDGAKVVNGLLPYQIRMAMEERIMKYFNFNNIFVIIAVLLVLVFFVASYIASFTGFLADLLIIYPL